MPMSRWRALRKVPAKKLFIFMAGISFIVFYCEFLVYYITVFLCSWPTLPGASGTRDTLKALLVADPHLLGPRKGHWLDKWRREKQMSAAFAAVVRVHAPEAVFFLGDLFDEGTWSRESQFSEYVDRFRNLFPVPPGTGLYLIAGNHDIGFHHEMSPHRAKRFEEQLNAPPVRLVSLKGSNFVLLNSMAMEGDRCTLCRAAVESIKDISKRLSCPSGTPDCRDHDGIMNASRPILMQHFPLHRASDAACTGPEAAPLPARTVPFRNKIDSLSREATDFLVKRLNPRAAFGGHTHHGCELQHPSFLEYSVPSFSWRNRPDPRYYLVKITPIDVAVSKCPLPRETDMAAAAVISLALLLYVVVKYNYLRRRYFRGDFCFRNS